MKKIGVGVVNFLSSPQPFVSVTKLKLRNRSKPQNNPQTSNIAFPLQYSKSSKIGVPNNLSISRLNRVTTKLTVGSYLVNLDLF